jgi:SAM-dependent methyltransferase
MPPSLAHLPFSPAAERNAPPLLAVLGTCLPGPAHVLEIASGTGQHAAHFACARPDWQWQPSEAQVALLPAIAERCSGLANVLPPVSLDITSLTSAAPAGSRSSSPGLALTPPFDAIFCANLLHISPWPTCEALMSCAAKWLSPTGLLIVYGPFLVEGEAVADSNLAFDADLRERNPAWGLRALDAVASTAQASGLALLRRTAMPANNLALVFALGGNTARPSRPAQA